MTDPRPYRFNVGVALFNARGEVFLGKSIPDGPEYVLPGFEWQMPQGGIDPPRTSSPPRAANFWRKPA